MINTALFKRETKYSLKMLLIFIAVMAMYVTIIIAMYEPELMKTLDSFVELMPEIMAAVGMHAGANNLVGFMISYLYGFILIVIPMVFAILRGNGLIAKYVDRGSMATLLSAPVKRRTVVTTQICVLISGILFLVAFATGLQLAVCRLKFPEEQVAGEILKMNAGLLCLQLFIGGICFLASCVFDDGKRSITVGAGVPALMFVIQMLANVGEKAEKLKYITFFTLFDPSGIVKGESGAVAGAGALLLGAAVLYTAAAEIFCRRDLSV